MVICLLLLTGCAPAAETTARRPVCAAQWCSGTACRTRARRPWPRRSSRFESLHPDAEVILRRLPTEEALLAEFQTAVQSGLGADLILTSSNAVNTLAASGAIRPLDADVDSQLLNQYLASALTTLRYEGALYGLPFDLNTQVLYYNTELAPTPAATLEQLAADARSGKVVLLNSRFRDALWGFRAFGAPLIDAQSSALTFNQGGFVNWLTWLQQARETPGFVLDPDQAMLRQAFLDGRGAYYVGRASDLAEINAAMGDRMGVAPLPAGPNGGAGPLLSTNGFMVNAMSSATQAELAIELARFVTNAEQQSVLMRETLLVPANITTRISPGLFPAVAAIGAQARTAIALPNSADAVAVLTTIASAFDGVGEGLTRPTDAALALNNQLAGLVPGATQSQATAICPAPGSLTVSKPTRSAPPSASWTRWCRATGSTARTLRSPSTCCRRRRPFVCPAPTTASASTATCSSICTATCGR
jgi:arabinogalactan oligomer/maltooligosaccharide transport system substrate-binding protein